MDQLIEQQLQRLNERIEKVTASIDELGADVTHSIDNLETSFDEISDSINNVSSSIQNTSTELFDISKGLLDNIESISESLININQNLKSIYKTNREDLENKYSTIIHQIQPAELGWVAEFDRDPDNPGEINESRLAAWAVVTDNKGHSRLTGYSEYIEGNEYQADDATDGFRRFYYNPNKNPMESISESLKTIVTLLEKIANK